MGKPPHPPLTPAQWALWAELAELGRQKTQPMGPTNESRRAVLATARASLRHKLAAEFGTLFVAPYWSPTLAGVELAASGGAPEWRFTCSRSGRRKQQGNVVVNSGSGNQSSYSIRRGEAMPGKGYVTGGPNF
ncbi:hypothetical protein A0257_15065 [Hymenobacter psoromatis]|nr:hypothetical protein A0257_15065 [Hymenobacter psoromatis]